MKWPPLGGHVGSRGKQCDVSVLSGLGGVMELMTAMEIAGSLGKTAMWLHLGDRVIWLHWGDVVV